MDTIYSTSLLLALVSGGLGCTAVLSAALAAAAGRAAPPWLRRACRTAGAIAVISGVLSAVVHASFGHGPGSPEPMPLGTFVMHHKAYWLAAVLAAGSLAGGWPLGRGGRGRTPEG